MKNGKYLTSLLMILAGVLWVALFPLFGDEFLEQYYYMPFLGVIAATIANTTPAAAGIVYFPVLTRLQISPSTAVQFSLIIQAYGMGLGTLKWRLVNKSLFLTKVMPLSICGGIIGIIASIVYFPIANSELLTLVFNTVSFLFTQVIFFSIITRREFPNLTIDLTPVNITVILVFSLIGGLVSGWIGFGIDTMFYFILTLIYRINPAIAIVTSISIMAVVSVAGTILNIIFNSPPWALWYSALPGVTIAGLFLAAYLAVKIGPKNILILFALFLSLDFFMAFWTQHTIPISLSAKVIFTYILVAYLLAVHVKIFKQSYGKINKPQKGRTPPEDQKR